MEVIVGTYEEFILAYKLITTEETNEFEKSFTDHTHTGCVKSVAASNNGILAGGSSDERISLFHLKKRKELGMLVHHTGSITSIQFFGKKHMFSASEDGSIGIWKVANWECLRTLRGHKGTVNSVSIHPSGKLALSVGRDKTMRTWNLITGKQAYITNVKEESEKIAWCPSGENFALLFPRHINIYSTETSEVTCSFKLDFRIQTMTFLKEGFLLVAGDSGKAEIMNTTNKESCHEMDTKTSRVKCMECRGCPQRTGTWTLTTGSSDGYIKLWEIYEKNNLWSSKLVAEVDTKFRILSLAVAYDKTTTPPQEELSAPKTQEIDTEEACTSTQSAVPGKRKHNELDTSKKRKKKQKPKAS